MKFYKIKISNIDTYIKAVMFGGKPFVQVLTTGREDAAIYEEDKAKKYVEILNKENKDKNKIQFELEELNNE